MHIVYQDSQYLDFPCTWTLSTTLAMHLRYTWIFSTWTRLQGYTAFKTQNMDVEKNIREQRSSF
jgi:hypothetical protein